MSNIPITYIEFNSSEAPSIRLLYSDIDISWKQALFVYRMQEEAEAEELFNMKLQARVRRLLMKRQKKTGNGDSDIASSSYCQETTATNESSMPRQRTQTQARQHRASLCFAATDQRREQAVRPMKMKLEKEEDCQSNTLFDSSDFDTPSGYRVSTPTHWHTLDEVAVVDDVLPAPPATPISHKLLLHKEESSIYNERGLDDFVFKLRHHQTDGRRVVHRTHTARCA